MRGRTMPFNVCVGGRYGAPMGRTNKGEPDDAYLRLRHRMVPLHDGDYDGWGAYWGYVAGEPMFCAWSADKSVIRYGRARSYLMFQEAVRKDFPQADFL